GLTGYSLPDDLLSGTGVRFAQGAILSTTPAAWAWWGRVGGPAPGCAQRGGFAQPGIRAGLGHRRAREPRRG
ncbi:hypothetical protein AB0B67_28215, partial [Streptomyces spectabilis]